ncbi:8824_t:CDS:2, partial [Ambispora leptoticha]
EIKSANQLEKKENPDIKKIFEIREKNRPLTSLLKNKVGYQQLEKYPQEVDYYLAKDEERKVKLEVERGKIEKEISSVEGEELDQKLRRKNDLVAFIHTSYLNELKLRGKTDLESVSENNAKLSSYETLEFLGDSALNFYTSLFIYHKFPDYAEGQMSKLKQLMVQESTLAHLSREIGLGEFLQLGTGERNNRGAEKESILADVFESFVAALYLERGGKMVQRFLNLTIFTWIKGKENMVIRIEHQQLFIMEVSDELKTFQESGKGRSKKEAEQQAAAKAIKKLGIGEEKKE